MPCGTSFAFAFRQGRHIRPPQYAGTLQAGFDVFITSLLLVSGLSRGDSWLPGFDMVKLCPANKRVPRRARGFS
ncbi:hypothetical protein MPLB_650023 [Mesorhizobium sp. ORS 3324]|nr:hypothetical protein MPLB_650023 [Mesorhizobium sp. ORS 3324]